VGYALAPGVTAYEAERAIERMLAEIMLPASVHTVPASAGRPDFSVNLSQPWLLLWVGLAVYLVLGVLYESTPHPLTILSTLPSAGVGALLPLILSNSNFSLITQLGLHMPNAVLMMIHITLYT